ncbi:RHS repeat domain-containing protein [Litorimonas sp.]|uniref:RHS repeat domain-containing protein n=1 Tax=Litorimonas sp. TaxID=1892381 RepID=UPI003A8906C9
MEPENRDGVFGDGEPFPHLGDIQAQYNSYNLDMLGNDLVGDHTDIDTGALSLTQTDVSLPGNNNLPVEFGRSKSRDGFAGSWLGDWVPSIPYISRHYLPFFGANTDRCTGDLYPDAFDVIGGDSHRVEPESYFNGFNLSVPGRNPGTLAQQLNGGGSPEFAGTGARMISKNNWIVTCLANAQSGGEGFIATAPNGDQYTFGFRKTYYEREFKATAQTDYTVSEEVLYVTEIKDVHNNWVRYEYAGGRPSRIHSSDGREITFGYSGSKISSVTANGRTWSYQYDSSGYLNRVTLPDNRFWTMTGHTFALDPWVTDICAFHNSTSITPYTVKHPSGTTAKFDFTVIRNGRTHMTIVQKNPGAGNPTLQDCHIGYNSRASATGFYSFAVTKKTLTIPSGGTSIWTRDYEQDLGSYTDYSSHPADTKTRTITDPLGHETVFHVNRRFGPLEGSLMKTEVIPAGQSTPLRTVENSYATGNIVGIELAGRHFGGITNFSKTTRIYKTQTETSQDGDVFTTDTDYNTNPGSSDFSYGKPTLIEKYSNVTTAAGWEDREIDISYAHNKTKWILGLTNIVTKNGRQYSDSDYDMNTGKLTAVKRFGAAFDHMSATYNGDGTLNTVVDALGRTNRATLWKRGTPQKVELAYNTSDEITLEQTVDDNGWVMTATDGKQQQTIYSRDSMGRLTLINPPGSWDNTSIGYNFSGGGAVQTITKGQGRTTITMDGLFRPILERTQALDTGWSSYVNTAYDGLGRVIFKSLPSTSASHTQGTNYTYDSLGRVKTSTETAANATTTHSYHANHRHTVTDPTGARTDYYSFGFEGPDSKNYRAIYNYANGAYSRKTDIYQNKWGETYWVRQRGDLGGFSVDQSQHFYYDNLGRLCRYRGEEGNDTLYNYNNADQMVAYQKGVANGSTCATASGVAKVTLGYDNLGRQTFTNFADSNTPNISRSYDDNNNILNLNRGNGASAVNWTYAYNSLDKLTNETLTVDNEAFDLDYFYNSSGYMVFKRYPSNRLLRYTPDGLGRATYVHDSNRDYATNYTFHASGTPSQISYDNGFLYSKTLNSRQLTDRLQATKGGVKALDLSYTYDSRGQITSITDGAVTGNNRTFTYDPLGQLKTASGPWGSGTNVYDSLGNIRSRIFTGSGSTGWSGSRNIYLQYDNKNRVYQSVDSQAAGTGVGGTGIRTVGYDNRGNVTTLGTMGFVYDYSDQPTVVSGSLNGGTATNGTYRYDGNLKRVRSQVNGDTIYNVYDASGKLVHIKDASASTYTDYISANGQAIGRIGSSGMVFEHNDHLGSPVATTNLFGAIDSRERYLPFGLGIDDPARLDDEVGFTGHIRDSATGLNYMEARYYDPVMGRFLSVDPVTFMETGEPGMFNRYAYVFNDPVNGADSTGMICDEGICGEIRNAVRNALPGPDNPQELVEKYGQPVSDIGQTMPSDQSISSGEMQVVGALTNALGTASIGKIGPNTTPAPAATRSVTASSADEAIYVVPGNATQSGKPYVGRSSDIAQRRKVSSDGRDRSQAQVVGRTSTGNARAAEQRAMNARGGVGQLDNKRNEVSPCAWSSCGISPPE